MDAPALAAADVLVRPRRPADTPFLYSVASRFPQQWPRLCRRGLPKPHELELLLSYEVVSAEVIEMTEAVGVAAVGLVSVFDADERAGTAWLDCVGLPGAVAEAARLEATTRVIDRLFTQHRYRKIYARYFSMTENPLRQLPCAVHEEARLTGQIRHDDRWWDEVIVGVFRDEWPDLEARP